MNKQRMYVAYSERESSLLGIRFARGRCYKDWQPEQLRSHILALNLDVIRIKVNASEPLLFQKLLQTGFPYSIYSIILRNQVEVTQTTHLDNDLNFELYNGTQTYRFTQLFTEAISHPTGINFYDPELEPYFRYEIVNRAACDYVEQFNNILYPEQYGWLITQNSVDIGFVFGTTTSESFEGMYYGISPQFRGTRQYARTIHRHIKNFCFEKGLRYFENDVPFQNFASLRALFAEGILPIEAYLNIHMKPFLANPKGFVVKS